MYECENCSFGYDPVRYRWLCPNCHFKGACCQGAPLPERTVESSEEVRAEWAEKPTA